MRFVFPHLQVPQLMILTDGATAYEALQKGLDDLMDLCDVVIDKFTEARDTFNREETNRMET